MATLSIDPGNEQSAYVLWDGAKIVKSAKLSNPDTLNIVAGFQYESLTIEMIASYGMAVGKSVFETCLWVGRFDQCYFERFGTRARLVYRQDIKIHICKSPRANDSTIRQALIDRLGAPGTKKAQGPTYGMSGDMWAALAVAVYAHDTANFASAASKAL